MDARSRLNRGQTVFGSELVYTINKNRPIDLVSIFSIHLASDPNYVLGHEGTCHGFGDNIILWLDRESDCSKWEVKPFYDPCT